MDTRKKLIGSVRKKKWKKSNKETGNLKSASTKWRTIELLESFSIWKRKRLVSSFLDKIWKSHNSENFLFDLVEGIALTGLGSPVGSASPNMSFSDKEDHLGYYLYLLRDAKMFWTRLDGD